MGHDPADVEDETMKYDQDIEQMLPWYAKDLLSDEEKSQVDRYLDDYPDMRAQLQLIEEENIASQQVHDALGGPLPGGLDRLMARIDVEESAKDPVGQISQAGNGLLAKVAGLFDGFSRPALQIAGMAAAVVIVVQALVIGGMLRQDTSGPVEGGQVASVPTIEPSGAFKTASGKKNAMMAASAQVGAKLLIAFKSDAKVSDISALLKISSATIVAGPKAGGIYEIFVAEDKLPEGGAKMLSKDLAQQKTLVKFVSVTK
ncbi:hypothetical protein [Cohaesibacter gelatinilyticus]|nr:hypothetical protein [Cohaesibacter gelatinilyticus]